MNEEETEKSFLEYLNKKGFKQAALAFRQEKQQRSNGSDNLSTAQVDPDIAKQIVAFPVVDGPLQYQEGYSKLRSLDLYKHELMGVLYPAFIHSFMDLVSKGHILEAQAFFNDFRGDHEMTHSKVLFPLRIWRKWNLRVP